MKRLTAKEIISRVLFWLGLFTALGSMAALEFLGYGKPTVWVREFDLMTAAVVLGLVMIAASIVLDLVGYVKERGENNARK